MNHQHKIAKTTFISKFIIIPVNYKKEITLNKYTTVHTATHSSQLVVSTSLTCRINLAVFPLESPFASVWIRGREWRKWLRESGEQMCDQFTLSLSPHPLNTRVNFPSSVSQFKNLTALHQKHHLKPFPWQTFLFCVPQNVAGAG